MAEEKESRGSSLLSELPGWFFAIAALVYGTGFLVVSTFFESFGIKEAGGDFFRAKYIHVGILCILFQAFAGVPLFAFGMMRSVGRERKAAGKQSERVGHLPSVLLVLTILATFYVFAMFSPRGYARSRGHLIPLVFFVSLLGLAIIAALDSKQVNLRLNKAWARVTATFYGEFIKEIFRWLLFAGMVLFLVTYAFTGLGPDLWEMFFGIRGQWIGGYTVFSFDLIILWLLWRTRRRTKDFPEHRLRAAAWAMSSCMMVAAYFLAVLSFAFTVYPYIPAEKGGGSFVDNPTVVLWFKGDARGLISPEILDSGGGGIGRSMPLIMIEETAFSFYLAAPGESDGPGGWRRGKRPRIFNISRESVADVSRTAPPTGW